MGAIDVIRWDPAPRVFAYRYENCQLNHQSQLVVSEGQEAVLVKEGLYYGPILPGRHTLETKNFPFLTRISTALISDAKSPYTAEIWFLQKSVPLDVKWGTPDPILIEDPRYHVALPVRAFGQYGIKVVDSCRFLAMLSGRLPAFTEKTLSGYFKGIVITRAKNAIATILCDGHCSILNIGTKLDEISASLEKRISEDLSGFGLELRLFTVNSISTDENDASVAQLKKALAKKAEMEIVGYSYVQERSLDALQAAARNEGLASGPIGAGVGMGLGVGLCNPMGNAIAAVVKNIDTGNAKHCMQCGALIAVEAKFCSQCGAPN